MKIFMKNNVVFNDVRRYRRYPVVCKNWHSGYSRSKSAQESDASTLRDPWTVGLSAVVILEILFQGDILEWHSDGRVGVPCSYSRYPS